ncbi:hypothetical protein BFJ71_g15934 [Fusarium oxysporum]|nr:hypothetical protein BFJ71_g15934 [Fusarium oxysporum]
MNCLNHQEDRNRYSEHRRRYHHTLDNQNESRHHHVHVRPPYDPDMGSNQQSGGWEDISHRLSSESSINEAYLQPKSSHHQRSHMALPAKESQTSYHTAKKKRSKSEHAVGKGIGTGAELAFQIRNDRGSWVGKKGAKVVSAAITSAAIDFLLGTDPKKHPLAHIAVSMVQGVVTNSIANGE